MPSPITTVTDDRYSLFQLPVFVIGAYGLWRGKACVHPLFCRGAVIVRPVVFFQTREESTASSCSTAPLPARRPSRASPQSWIPPPCPPQPSRKRSSLSPPSSAPCSSPAMCPFLSSRFSLRWTWQYGCRNWHPWAFVHSIAQRKTREYNLYPSLLSSTLS